MRIWQRVLIGLLAIAGLAMIVTFVSISLSLQIGRLRKVELPMEQNLREVEVSIWEAIHAANAFRSTSDPYYTELYEKQVKHVDEHLSKYLALLDTPTENDLAKEFEFYWAQAKAEGDTLIAIVQRETVAEDEFFSLVDRADYTIDFKIQAMMSPSDANILAKEQALREVEVSIWEALHAGITYTGLTPRIASQRHVQTTFSELMHRQFRDVDEYWRKYTALATSDDEMRAISEFEEIWRQAIDTGAEVVSLHDQASRRLARLYERVDLADDVIDFKMQAYIQKRIHNRDESARMSRAVTIAIGLLAVIGAAVIFLIITQSISGPIRLLMLAADEFGQGNLAHRIDSQRKDEFGDLSRAFDRMGRELECALIQINREVAERKQAEAATREAREYLEMALEQSSSGIIIADAPDGLIRLANRAALDIRGGDRQMLTQIDMTQHAEQWQIYRTDGTPYPTDQLPLSVAVLEGEIVRNAELIIRDKEGNNRWVSANAAPIRDAEGQIAAGIVVFNDISERRQMMEQMQDLAFHDTLTGLPNRSSILRSIQDVIDRRNGSHFALLFLDFDRFKLINDSLGHDMGDELLKQIAHRLRNALRATDGIMIPARLGGDEFVILLDNLASPQDATPVAERLLQVLSQSYDLDGQTVCSTASIGVVTSDHGFTSASDMLRDADLAMYKSKSEGKARYTVFDQILREAVQDRLRVENEMRDGISRDEFVLVYQPIVSLKTGRMEGAEALLRWRHPKRGLVGADEFISVAEETGMIIPIGNGIIDEACRQLAKWQRSPRGSEQPLCVHVNISRKQLLLPNLISVVERALQEHAVLPQCLHLEVTETVIMDDPTTAIATLSQLRELGVKIDIDDFGTGYSSLSCLHEFPLDVLKIDRAFIDNMKDTPDLAALLQAVLTLADHLELRVVAEGIEDIEQLQLLRALGCEYGQGYLFAKPMSSEDVVRFLGSTLSMMPSESEVLTPANWLPPATV